LTKDEALQMCLEYIETNAHERKHVRHAIQAALAQPAQEPFGYFKAEPFGWTDCVETEEGAKALYEAPLKREWVGLTEEDFSAINQSCLTKLQAAASTESILNRKNT